MVSDSTALTDLPVPTAARIESAPNPLCPFCRRPGELLYAGMVDWLYGVPGNWETRKCSSCGVAWLDPRPAPSDISRLYSNYCTHEGNRQLNGMQGVWDCVLARIGYPVDAPKTIIPRLLSHLPFVKRTALLSVLLLPASERGSLLDVGCGNGEFIARMRSFGWNVKGLDFDPSAVSYAQNQGLDVQCGTIADLPESTVYDVIVLSHVVEHVPYPVELFRECAKRLRASTGRLVISTPNINSLGHAWFKRYWRGLEVPRHFVLFSPAGLRECVEQGGLVVGSMTTENRLAQMIYKHSACAKAGERGVAERINFDIRTKIASRLFRMLEGAVLLMKKDAGEEIFCVCTKRLGNN